MGVGVRQWRGEKKLLVARRERTLVRHIWVPHACPGKSAAGLLMRLRCIKCLLLHALGCTVHQGKANASEPIGCSPSSLFAVPVAGGAAVAAEFTATALAYKQRQFSLRAQSA